MTSQINANDIDGNYPVAGQPNNTQGMRDNFTNTKTNFQYAADEITNLQTVGVFKAALSGTTLDNNMNDNLIYAVKLNDVSYTYLPLTATSGSINIDYSAATFQQISTTGSISLSFSNWPASGSAGTVRVGFNITNVAHTVTLPASVSQGISTIAGSSPGTPGVSNTITFGAVGNYAFEFVTVDGGTTIWIFDDSRSPDHLYANLTITNSTVSTSSTTGAFVVSGGVGIGGNLNVGGNISVTGNVLGNLNVTGNIAGGNILTPGIISATGNISTTGHVTLTDGGTVGYGVGAGGTVTQSGGKNGGVTLNKPSGQITMASGALAAGATATFVLTNSTIHNTDVMIINHVSGGTTSAYQWFPVCNTGNASITVINRTGGSLNEQPVIRFAVISGSIT